MTPTLAGIQLTPVDGAVPAWRAEVDAGAWRTACEAAHRAGGRLAALWASDERDRQKGFGVCALLVLYEGSSASSCRFLPTGRPIPICRTCLRARDACSARPST
jgi:hypothetical protein